MSAMSRAKNTGWNGEFWLILSISLTFSGSSAIGSGGTLRFSAIGSGGIGGRLALLAGSAGGGGIGRATGGVFLPHAPTVTARTIRIHKADVRLKCILLNPPALLRPVRILVRARFRDLLQTAAVTVHR